MNRLSIALLALTLSLPVTATADDYSEIVTLAFAAIDNQFDREWAFTETTTEEESTYVGRYDPREEDPWTLLSVDGREPTADEAHDWRSRKGDGRRDDDEDDDGDDDSVDVQFVTPETITLLEETAEHWLFGFEPTVAVEDEHEAKFRRHVEGRLKVIKDGHYVGSIDLRNSRPIKPAFSVRINTFVTTLTFGPAAEGGPIVPLTVDVHVQGRAMLAVRFDETEAVRFTDYEYAGVD